MVCTMYKHTSLSSKTLDSLTLGVPYLQISSLIVDICVSSSCKHVCVCVCVCSPWGHNTSGGGWLSCLEPFHCGSAYSASPNGPHTGQAAVMRTSYCTNRTGSLSTTWSQCFHTVWGDEKWSNSLTSAALNRWDIDNSPESTYSFIVSIVKLRRSGTSLSNNSGSSSSSSSARGEPAGAVPEAENIVNMERWLVPNPKWGNSHMHWCYWPIVWNILSLLTDTWGLSSLWLSSFDDAVGNEFGQKVVDIQLPKMVFCRGDLWSCRNIHQELCRST